MRAVVERVGGPVRPSGATLGAAFALMVALVGANAVAIRYTNRTLAPFWNAGLRFALAASVFGAIAVARHTRLPDGRALVDAVAYGVLSFAAFFGFLYVGLVHASAGLGQVVLALGPLITLAMAVGVGLERFRWRPVGGGLIALAGIGLMYGVDSGDVPPLSIVWLVAATASFAAGGIVAKRARPADPVVRSAIAAATGSIVLLGLSLVFREPRAWPGDAPTLLALAYLVLPGTIGVFLLFLLLLRHWSATTVATQFVLAPVVGIVLGAAVLGEPISVPIVVGAGLVIAGVWFGAIRAG